MAGVGEHQRHFGIVVNDDHIEQIIGIALLSQRGQGQVQLILAVLRRQHHGQRQVRGPGPRAGGGLLRHSCRLTGLGMSGTAMLPLFLVLGLVDDGRVDC